MDHQIFQAVIRTCFPYLKRPRALWAILKNCPVISSPTEQFSHFGSIWEASQSDRYMSK